MSEELTRMQVAVNLMSGDDDDHRQPGSWFEAMAEAWGEALDRKAGDIQELSETLNAGLDTPAQITQMTAESLSFGYLSNSSHTALTAVGSALETLARKQ